MKLKTSCFNKTIFLKNITHFWPIWLMITGWNIFIMPFMIYNTSLDYRGIKEITEKEFQQMRSNDLLSIVSVYINPVVLFIFSIIAVMAVFSYLYNSRAAHTIHALPVTRKELFVTNYISGLLFLIIPEAVGFLLGTLVGAMCGYTNINHLLTGFLLACGISFALYSLTTFIAMFTGQLLAIPIFTVILNFLYIGMKSMAGLLMSMLSYGMTLEISGSKADLLSPLYYLTRHVNLVHDYSREYTVCTGISGKSIVAGYALAAVVFVIAAYMIYEIRDMETAGSLISIPWISPVFRWGAAFCGGVLFSILFCGIMGISSSRTIFVVALIFGLIFGAAFFFGAQMFLEKGFRVFHKKRIIECGAFLLAFACLYVVIETDLFGLEKKIPDISQVESVRVDNFDRGVITDPELIQEIMDIHKQIIDSKKEFERYSETGQDTYYIYISYNLKKGTLKRRYDIPISKEMLDDPDTVIHRIVEFVKNPRVYRNEVFSVSDENINFQEGYLDLYDKKGEYSSYEFSKEELEEIYQAFLADVEEGNFNEYIYKKYTYDSSWDSNIYFNSINIDYTSKDKKENASSGNAYEDSIIVNTASIQFDVNCKNIIAALIKMGAIDSEEDLITIEEKTKLDGKDDVYID